MTTIHAWPRFMRRSTAAAYVDLSETLFEREVSAGVLPMPSRLGGKCVWSKLVLDEYLSRIDGTGSRDWELDQPLFQEKAA